MDSTVKLSIREKAIELGFSDIGFSPIGRLTHHEPHLRSWLDNGYHAGMAYMANHFEKRLDPALLVEDAKSVISLVHNYYPKEHQLPGSPVIARYAYGQDYHDVLRQKMNLLFDFIRDNHFPSLEGRVFVDSAPVMERAWAAQSGLGWIGKNGLLIHRRLGSFLFISELITNLDVDAGFEVPNRCGNCTRCIDACPTGALLGNGVLDANRCISYLTIEHKGEIPDGFRGKFQNRLFGCDICQEVCPWNRKLEPHQEPAFVPHPHLLRMDAEQWQNLTEDDYASIFSRSAVKRTKFQGLMRNIRFLSAVDNKS